MRAVALLDRCSGELIEAEIFESVSMEDFVADKLTARPARRICVAAPHRAGSSPVPALGHGSAKEDLMWFEFTPAPAGNIWGGTKHDIV